MCGHFAMPLLRSRVVIVVDDVNYAHVRQVNRDFVRVHREFPMLFESCSE